MKVIDKFNLLDARLYDQFNNKLVIAYKEKYVSLQQLIYHVIYYFERLKNMMFLITNPMGETNIPLDLVYNCRFEEDKTIQWNDLREIHKRIYTECRRLDDLFLYYINDGDYIVPYEHLSKKEFIYIINTNLDLTVEEKGNLAVGRPLDYINNTLTSTV